jgi:polyphosphate kinase 2 (PPK2 family)
MAVHKQTPGRGEMVIFNRSRMKMFWLCVHELAPSEVWWRRYEQINDFERLLAEEGTTVLKFSCISIR